MLFSGIMISSLVFSSKLKRNKIIMMLEKYGA